MKIEVDPSLSVQDLSDMLKLAGLKLQHIPGKVDPLLTRTTYSAERPKCSCGKPATITQLGDFYCAHCWLDKVASE